MTSAATHFAEKRSIDAREVPDGERKTVTALFADIKGSTELIEDLDPDETGAIVDTALKLSEIYGWFTEGVRHRPT